MHPYFEYQVEIAARFIGDTIKLPRPRTPTRPGVREVPESTTLVVALVVDSLGAAQKGSLRILKSPSREATASVYATYATWRFTPAVLGGCRVSQLVQTAVRY